MCAVAAGYTTYGTVMPTGRWQRTVSLSRGRSNIPKLVGPNGRVGFDWPNIGQERAGS